MVQKVFSPLVRVPTPPADLPAVSQSKAPAAMHGMLRNPYRQSEVIGVAFRLSDGSQHKREECCRRLVTQGFTQVRDKTWKGATEIIAAGTIAQVRAALCWDLVSRVELQKGWLPS